ncbi:hypothetical protein TNCV_3148771 [Trichonephila clavipes]|nr:hypothetical protein TNCV_3148771 [Trichonephila clavipes]
MQWLLCVLTWIRGRSNVTVMVVNVTMKRERSFISPQDVKNPGGILFHFREDPLRKCSSLCGIPLCGKSSWHDCNLYIQLEGVDEEYCGQMMVVRYIILSLKLLRRNRFHFDIGARAL